MANGNPSRRGTADVRLSYDTQPERFPPPDGGLLYARIPWDSELFGFSFYELKCSEINTDILALHLPAWLDWISQRGKCLVVASLVPTDVERIKIIAQKAFYPIETLIETRVILARFKPRIEHRLDYLRMFLADEKDMPALIEIARSAFSADRFHLDKNIPAETADLRYARWLENIFKAGDYIFVLRDMRFNRPAGFVTARGGKNGIYDMSLAAVGKDYHNTGAGVILYQNILIESKARGFKQTTAWISVNNLNSLKAAERVGFSVHNVITRFHWFHDASHK